MKVKKLYGFYGVVALLLLINGCTKSGGGGGGTTDPCAGKTIVVTGSTGSSDPCTADGTIKIDATGSTGFTYNVNGGAFQADNSFSKLAAGTYTIGAKDGAGCFQTASVTIGTKAAGSLFTAVKSVISTNCAKSGCHNGAQSPNFTVDCTIAANAALIKSRAVDQAGTASQMPQPPNAALSVADRNKITDWVNGGGKVSN